METFDRNIGFPLEDLTKKIFRLPPTAIWFYIFIISIILAIGGFSYRILEKHFIRQKSLEISSIAELKSQQIYDFRQRRINDALFFYDNTTFIHAVNKYVHHPDTNTLTAMEAWMVPMLKNRVFQKMYILTPQGKCIYGAGNDAAKDSFSLESVDLLSLRSGNIEFGNFTRDKHSRIQISVYVPLIDNQGILSKNIAVLKMVMDPYIWLYPIIKSMPNKGETGEVMVVKQAGDKVVFLNELRFKKGAALNLRLPLNTKDLAGAQAILGNQKVSEAVDYRGKKVLAIAKKIPDSEWSVIVKFDRSEVFEEIRTFSVLIIAIILVLIISSALGLFILLGRKKLVYYRARIDDLATIDRLNQVYKLILNVEQSIVINRETHLLLHEVCHIISDFREYSLCWIGLFDNKTRLLTEIIECSKEKQYLEYIKILVGDSSNFSKDPSINAIIEDKVFLSNDIWNDESLKDWREEMMPRQFNSMVVFPLTQNGRVMGALFIYSEHKAFFMDDEIRLLERLCKDVSYAMEKIDLEKKERKARLNLKAANDELFQANERLQKVNHELVAAREKAENSNRLKSVFLANMSHEIRTPMNAIVGFAGLLENPEIQLQKRHDFCRIIIERSNDLLKIIDDILDISKIDSHTATVYHENIELNAFLDELHLIYQEKLDEHNHTISLHCEHTPENHDLEISTDVLKFRQIFTNLLDNAIKFTDHGEIRFGYEKHDAKNLWCFVSDTGVGIDLSQQQEIFEIFRQAERKDQKNYGGTGLGLAICRGNARLLGGDVHVQSLPDKGSRFYFNIKFTSREVFQHDKESIVPQPDENIWKEKDVLLVEDDHYSVQYFANLFSDTGIRLHVAKSGRETENYLHNLQDIDLVLMDIRLPDANGTDLMRKMKMKRNNLPVIAQTAFAMEDDKIQYLSAGFDDYIAKPFKREKIMQLIGSYLNRTSK